MVETSVRLSDAKRPPEVDPGLLRLLRDLSPVERIEHHAAAVRSLLELKRAALAAGLTPSR